MFFRGLVELARSLARLIYPNSCLICDAPEPSDLAFQHGLCLSCLGSIASAKHACPRCAATVGPHTDLEHGCPACRGASFAFQAATRLGEYDGPLRDGILRMKHWAGEALAEMLGRIMAQTLGESLRKSGIEVVVPIPLHWWSRIVRGYNQAGAIARELASELHIPFKPRWLVRVKSTPQHVQPSATARRENIRGAFRCPTSASPAGKRILLVDDVMTTGATLHEAARVLREAGAASVEVAVLARR